MSWNIILDNSPYSLTADDLPALIHGEKHVGASLFALTTLAELYRQGHPVLFIASDIATKNEFITQTSCGDNLLTIEKETDLIGAETFQALFLSHKDILLLPSILSTLPDIQERVILLHNIEELPEVTISLLTEHPLSIFSGNLNMCSSKELLLQLKYNAKIFFSPLTNDFRLTLPQLEKYQGYFLGRISQGKIQLKTTDHEQG